MYACMADLYADINVPLLHLALHVLVSQYVRW